MSGVGEMFQTMTESAIGAMGGDSKFAAALAEKYQKAPVHEVTHINVEPTGRGR